MDGYFCSVLVAMVGTLSTVSTRIETVLVLFDDVQVGV